MGLFLGDGFPRDQIGVFLEVRVATGRRGRLRIRIEEVGLGWGFGFRFLEVWSGEFYLIARARSLARAACFNPSPSCPKASRTASPSPVPPPTDETANTAATSSRPCRFGRADSRARTGTDPRRRGRLSSNWQGSRDSGRPGGPPGAGVIWRRGG